MAHRPLDRSAIASGRSERPRRGFGRHLRSGRIVALGTLALTAACDGQPRLVERTDTAARRNAIELTRPPPLLQLRAVDRDALFAEVEIDVEGMSETVTAAREGASDTWSAELTVPTGTPFVLRITWYDRAGPTRLNLSTSSRSFEAFDDPGEASVTIDFDDFDSDEFDADDDLRSNLQERLDGTDPFDALSPEPPDDGGVAPPPIVPPPPVDGINAGNVRSLARFAVRMNIVTLTDRDISPAAFFEDFPGNEEASLAGPGPAPPDATGSASVACPLGGSYDQFDMGTREDFSFSRMLTYNGCVTESGTLDGSYDYFQSSGGSITFDDYDLTLRQTSGPDGAGDTVLRASFENDRFGGTRFSVEEYSRDTELNSFSVVDGEGGRQFMPTSETDFVYVYETETSITVVDDVVGRVELAVTTSDLAISQDEAREPVRGTISLVAPDGSRIDLGVSDTPGMMSLILTDASGQTFSDTIAWSELRDPQDEVGERRADRRLVARAAR